MRRSRHVQKPRLQDLQNVPVRDQEVGLDRLPLPVSRRFAALEGGGVPEACVAGMVTALARAEAARDGECGGPDEGDAAATCADAVRLALARALARAYVSDDVAAAS